MNAHLVLRGRRLSVRVPMRAALVLAATLLLLAVAVCVTAAYGPYPVPIAAVLRAVTGHGSGVDNVVLGQFRLPRITACVLLGAALGLSGGIFQLLTGNPLAAPDVIGVNQSAAAVAVWLLLIGAPAGLVPAGAFAGALAAIVAVATLGVRRRLSMYRLILVGIGINTLAAAMISSLLTLPGPVEMNRLATAQQWLLGSVTDASWSGVRVLGVALLVIAPMILACGRGLDTVTLGVDTARALGTPVRTIQLVTAGLAALLAAVTVSVAGPIGFVAFVSPHIARRLTRSPGAAALPVAMTIGALLLLLADYLAQRLLDPAEVPVGITTVVLGAPYLLLLVLRGERRAGIN